MNTPASDGQLQAGDVCIVVGCVMYPECNGRDLKVVRWDECPWQPEKINAA